jgi:transposase-like protein
MAHDPKLKAKVLKEWALGKSTIRELEAKHGVPNSTIQEWIDETGQNRADLSPKLNRYMESLEEFGCAAMKMLTSQAELYGEKEFLRVQPADDVIKQRESIMSQLERFVRLHRPVPNPGGHDALPERTVPGPVVIPELVEEDSPE